MEDAPLLAWLSALFAADPLIDEIGLLFHVAEEDLTPDSAFVYAEHKLGVAFCAGAPLFRQARTRFHALNPLLAALRRQDARDAGSKDSETVAELLQCTRAILLISADFYTAWNARKALVDLGGLDAVDEVRFTNLVFTLHPKSIDTWAYRRWLAIRLVAQLPSDEARGTFLEEQIGVCERLAEQKPRNYHAWSFRHWVVSQLGTSEALRSELKRMDKWCETHITDHSGWNHRQHTVTRLMRQSSPMEYRGVLKDEYELLSGIMALYPTHEALWCHRRFLIHLLLGQNDHRAGLAPVTDAEVCGVCEQIKDAEMQVAASSQQQPSSAVEGLESNGMSTAALREAWQSIQQDLVDDAKEEDATSAPRRSRFALVSSVCVREVGIAWLCGSKYARRYAAWCLERLRARTGVSQELDDSLNILSRSCRKLLAVEDATLQDLWESNGGRLID